MPPKPPFVLDEARDGPDLWFIGVLGKDGLGFVAADQSTAVFDVEVFDAARVGCCGRRAEVEPKPEVPKVVEDEGCKGCIDNPLEVLVGCSVPKEFIPEDRVDGCEGLDGCIGAIEDVLGVVGEGVDQENLGPEFTAGGDFVVRAPLGVDDLLFPVDCHSNPLLTGAASLRPAPNTKSSKFVSLPPEGDEPPFIALRPGAPPNDRNSPAVCAPVAEADSSSSFRICSDSIF
jgi:hypothetical protein